MGALKGQKKLKNIYARKPRIKCVVSQILWKTARFFREQTMNGNNYFDMLEHFSFLQLQDLHLSFIVQQDNASPHWKQFDWELLDKSFPLMDLVWQLNILTSMISRLDNFVIILSGALLRTDF